MTHHEWQILLALIVVAAITGILATMDLHWSIDRHMDRSRPETPVLNQMGVE
jgi:hypothetical protein